MYADAGFDFHEKLTGIIANSGGYNRQTIEMLVNVCSSNLAQKTKILCVDLEKYLPILWIFIIFLYRTRF